MLNQDFLKKQMNSNSEEKVETLDHDQMDYVVEEKNEKVELGGQQQPSFGGSLFSSLIGGSTTNLGLFDNNESQYTEYFTKLKEKLELKLKSFETNNGVKTDVVIIPTTNEIGKIPYATLVLSTIYKNTCFYYFFQFTNTGKTAMTASELMDAWTHNQSILNSPAGMYADRLKPLRLYDSVPGEKYKKVIIEYLTKHYGTRYSNNSNGLIEFKPLQGSNLGPKVTEIEPEKMADILLSVGYNQIRLKIGQLENPNGEFDVSLSDLTSHADWKSVINVSLLGVPATEDMRSTNYVGDYVRTDFEGQVTIEKINGKNSIKSQDLVTLNDTRLVCEFGGYISALPGNAQVKDMKNNVYYDCIRLMPHIILTRLEGVQRTPNLTLLALVSAGVMYSKDNYLACLKQLVNTTDNCPGKYNLLTDLTREGANKVAPFDFSNKKTWTEDAIVNCLSSMFTLSPVISADFNPFGDQGTIDSIFAYAARGDIKPSSRAKALQEIVRICHEMTAGKFPATYDTGMIFAKPAVPVPLGYYTDSTGIKDIRYIDLATVLTYYKGNEKVLDQWLWSELPEFKGNFDPYFAKVDIIANVIGARDAVITGRGIRVTFHPKFIETLTEAVTSTGFSPEYTPFGVSPMRGSLYESFGSAFSGAGLDQNLTFGSRHMHGGPNVNANGFFFPNTFF